MLSRRFACGLPSTGVLSELLPIVRCKVPTVHNHIRFFSESKCTLNSSENSTAKKNIPFGRRIKNGAKFMLSSAIVLAALGVTSVSLYLVFKELFSPSGQTSTFNRVVSMIEENQQCLKMLGYSDEEIKKGKIKLKAYGDVPQDRWTRDRPIRATQYTAKDGTDRLIMRFFVESKYTVGVVRVEAIEENVVAQKFNYVTLDVKGNNRFYLVGHPQNSGSFLRPMGLFNSKNGFLGVKWGKKDDNNDGDEKH